MPSQTERNIFSLRQTFHHGAVGSLEGSWCRMFFSLRQLDSQTVLQSDCQSSYIQECCKNGEDAPSPPARDPDCHPGEHPRSAQGGPWTVDHGPARPSRNLSLITYLKQNSMSGYILKHSYTLHQYPDSINQNSPIFQAPPRAVQICPWGQDITSHIPEPRKIKFTTTANTQIFHTRRKFPTIQEKNQVMGNVYFTVCIQCGQI